MFKIFFTVRVSGFKEPGFLVIDFGLIIYGTGSVSLWGHQVKISSSQGGLK